MGDSKTTFSFRVENDTAQAVNEYVEERGVNRTDVLRRAVEDYVEEEGLDSDDDSGGASVGELAKVTFFERLLPIVVAALVAATIVLLAIGALEADVGPLLGSASAVGVLGIGAGADRRLDDTATTAREAVAELENPTVSAARKWVWARLRGDHPAPLEPRTLVERLAVVDLYGVLLLWTMILVMIPAGIGVWAWGPEAVVEAVGAPAFLVYFYLVTFGFAVASVCMLVGAVAQVAIGTAGGRRDSIADDDTTA